MPLESVLAAANVSPAEKILVVEDNPNTAEALARFLRLRGYAVEIAKDGPSAMVAVESDDPDVVLLDLGLPKMEDGLEVARQLRMRKGTKQPLLVAITGYGGPADESRSVDAGVDLHIVKPVKPLQLLDFLERFHQGAG